MRIFRLLVLIPYIGVTALSQTGGSTASIGVGGGFPAGGYRTNPFSGSAGFSASYEFRLFRYLAPDVGLSNLIPNYAYGSKYGITESRERVTFLSLGVRGVLPLAEGRVELFAGPAAAHIWSSVAEFTRFQSPNWLLEIDGGGRMAIGKSRRFWIGPTVRFSRDGGRPTEEWVSLTADFGFRF
jgi:hypothetical protein